MRFCKFCDKLFKNEGKYNKVCPKCTERIAKQALEKRKKIWQKKNGRRIGTKIRILKPILRRCLNEDV